MKNTEQMFMFKMDKKGVSQIVATILLVLISVGAVAILAGVIIPWVRNSLGEECGLDIVGKEIAKIDKEAYACYNHTGVYLSIEIREIDVSGFIVNIYSKGTSERFAIEEGTSDAVFMKDGSTDILIPDRGTEKTYLLKTSFTEEPGRAELAIVTEKGNKCEADSAELYVCVD